ncbi:hypothetical protein JKP88DRAFT_249648 [Tribonema minus]|uniref:Uncharacterized protein n=1 Tax=Tribonema minus TaxID=303371 RepID=A0A836C9E7_9STRA|nr:hypothetical protein JKP88DRAFT_249648 [Tribonema minus]
MQCPVCGNVGNKGSKIFSSGDKRVYSWSGCRSSATEHEETVSPESPTALNARTDSMGGGRPSAKRPLESPLAGRRRAACSRDVIGPPATAKPSMHAQRQLLQQQLQLPVASAVAIGQQCGTHIRRPSRRKPTTRSVPSARTPYGRIWRTAVAMLRSTRTTIAEGATVSATAEAATVTAPTEHTLQTLAAALATRTTAAVPWPAFGSSAAAAYTLSAAAPPPLLDLHGGGGGGGGGGARIAAEPSDWSPPAAAGSAAAAASAPPLLHISGRGGGSCARHAVPWLPSRCRQRSACRRAAAHAAAYVYKLDERGLAVIVELRIGEDLRRRGEFNAHIGQVLHRIDTIYVLQYEVLRLRGYGVLAVFTTKVPAARYLLQLQGLYSSMRCFVRDATACRLACIDRQVCRRASRAYSRALL